MFSSDIARYQEYWEKKEEQMEKLCARCGACCGAFDGDPCSQLQKAVDGTFFCRVYSDRLGIQKTLKGREINCVPLRTILHASWVNKSSCAYVRRFAADAAVSDLKDSIDVR